MMLSMPSRSGVPGATMSRALRRRGSCRASSSWKSSDEGATRVISQRCVAALIATDDGKNALQATTAANPGWTGRIWLCQAGEPFLAGVGGRSVRAWEAPAGARPWRFARRYAPMSAPGPTAASPDLPLPPMSALLTCRASRRVAAGRKAVQPLAAAGPSTGARPNFVASATRRSAWATPRSSPVRPTSPKQASGRPSPSRQRLAAVRRRERQGHRQVRAGLVDPHAARDVDEHVRRRPATGRRGGRGRRCTIARRLRSIPVATRRGGTISVGATSAWTSTSSGRCPPSRRARPSPAPRSPRRRSAPRRPRTSTSPPAAHLEDAHLAGRPEAVLQRAQRAEAALALALEEEHAVHQVLEHARARDGALLRHVADQDDGAVEPLRRLHDRRRRLAHLPDRARRPGHPLGVHGLDRVDHAGLGALRLERGQHLLERGLGDRRDRERARAQALGPQADLGGRLLARDVEHAPARRREVAQRHARDRRLADPGLAAEQDQRARDEAAARARGRARRSRCECGPPRASPRRAGQRASRGPRAGAREPPDRPALAGAGASTSVFHSPQPAQRPDQASASCPHDWQTYLGPRPATPLTLSSPPDGTAPPIEPARLRRSAVLFLRRMRRDPWTLAAAALVLAGWSRRPRWPSTPPWRPRTSPRRRAGDSTSSPPPSSRRARGQNAADVGQAEQIIAEDPERNFARQHLPSAQAGVRGRRALLRLGRGGLRGMMRPVLFTARSGATISGTVWATREGPGDDPRS